MWRISLTIEMRHAIITGLLGLVAIWTAAAGRADTYDSLLKDARHIISSQKGDVRLWAHPPRILLIGPEDAEQHLRTIMAQVEASIISPFGDHFFGPLHIGVLPETFASGQHPLSLRIQKGGPSGGHVVLELGPTQTGTELRYETDIVIFVGSRRDVAMINGLWGMNPKHNRAMLEGGKARCFYAARSSQGVRYGALVSIYPDETDALLEECLWEELLHALGPLQDADGTAFFSFDDRRDGSKTSLAQKRLIKQRRANDLLLLRALYESGAGPGGAPDTVLHHLDTLIRAR